MSFVIDSRIVADSVAVGDLPLCHVRLAHNACYPWLILLPRRADMVEITNLSPADYTQLWDEVAQVSRALQAITLAPKMNIGALGNVVRQLHVHIIARFPNDPAGLAPVWGHPAKQTYSAESQQALLTALKNALPALT